MRIFLNKNWRAPKNLALFSILTLLGLTGFAYWGVGYLSNLETHYSTKQFSPEKHPLSQKQERLQDLFQTTKNPQILTLLDLNYTEHGTWLESDRIETLSQVHASLEEIAGVSSVTSIANVEGASDTPEGINVGPLLADTPNGNWRERIAQDPLLNKQLVSEDGRTILIVFETEQLNNSDILAVVSSTRNILEQSFPESKIQIGGIAAMESSMSVLLSDELQNLCLFALLAMIVTLFLVFKNFTSVCIPLYIMAIANIIVLTFMALAKMPFTILSTTLPILVSVTVVSMVTHTMLRFAKEWKNCDPRFRNRAMIIRNTIRALFLPNLLTSLTTCVGFAALVTANVPLITQYGTIVAIGVMVSWIASMLALPPALYLAPIPRPRAWTQRSARWSIYVIQNAKPIFVSLVVLFVFCAFLGRDQQWSAILFDDVPEGQEARTSTERIDEQLGGMIGLDIVIHLPEARAWNDPGNIHKLDKLVKEWRTHSAVGSAVSIPDFLRAANMKAKRIPASRGAIAENYFLYSMSQSRPLDQYLTGEENIGRVALRLHDIPGAEMANLVGQIKAQTEAVFPEAKIETGGMATTTHHIRKELSTSLVWGFWEALGLIALLLLILFRSIRWTIVAIIPNLFPPVALLACMSIFKTAIEPGIAIIFSIALGLAFNNTVYLIGRLRSLPHQSSVTRVNIQRALYLEGIPCVLSTVSLIAGFTVFLVSYFQLNQLFGAYMLVSIVTGLVGDLFFLPTMIKLFPSLVPAVPVRKTREISTAQSSDESNSTDELELNQEEESEMSPVVAASIALLLLFAPTNATNAAKSSGLSAKQILDRVNKNMRSTDESASVKMHIIEKNGSVKKRELEIKRKAKSSEKSVIVRLVAPGDIRGTGLLSVEKSGEKNQWLYLPSSKRTRRILSQNQGGAFLGSELSYEDMGGSAGVDFKSKILKYQKGKKGKIAVIESRPKKGESAYSKIISWVPLGKNGYVVTRAQYYDQKGKLLKIAEFSKYKKFGNKVFRATKMQIKNVQNKRGTVMLLKDLSVNRGIDDDEFTVSSLEDSF